MVLNEPLKTLFWRLAQGVRRKEGAGRSVRPPNPNPIQVMISSAITLFLIGLIAVALGFGGVGSLALNIGWVLLGIGVLLAIIHAVSGRRTV